MKEVTRWCLLLHACGGVPCLVLGSPSAVGRGWQQGLTEVCSLIWQIEEVFFLVIWNLTERILMSSNE